MTRKLNTKAIVTLILAITLGAAFSSYAQTDIPDSLPPIGKGKLDGRVYVGTVGVVGDPASNKIEKLVFQRGWFTSFAFEDVAGFAESDYTTTSTASGYTFTSEVKNEKSGRMVWNGTVTEDSVKATAVWYRPGVDSVLVWCEGWRQRPVDPQNKPLDGKTFIGHLGLAGDTIGKPEKLTFAKGHFTSQVSQKLGFFDSKYYINPRYDTLYFMSTMPAPNDDQRQWSGWIVGNRMELKIEWIRVTDTMPQMLWFKGVQSTE